MKYLAVDQDGLIHNIVAWDGISPYQPDEGISLIPVDEATVVSPGDSWDGANVIFAPTPEPPAENPAKESARLKLTSLGLTEEEIAALVG